LKIQVEHLKIETQENESDSQEILQEILRIFSKTF
jgi:hypothetical protein